MVKNQEVRQVFFKIFDEYEENYFRFLDGEQTKKLMMALFAFHKTGETLDLSNDPLVGMAYNSICNNMIRDEQKYQDSCKRSRESYEKKKAEEEAKRKAQEEAERKANQASNGGIFGRI